jgi:hypothetical protein
VLQVQVAGLQQGGAFPVVGGPVPTVSSIVRVAVELVPRVALLGLLRASCTVSSPSARASLKTATVKVCSIWPGLKVNVPLVAR